MSDISVNVGGTVTTHANVLDKGGNLTTGYNAEFVAPDGLTMSAGATPFDASFVASGAPGDYTVQFSCTQAADPASQKVSGSFVVTVVPGTADHVTFTLAAA